MQSSISIITVNFRSWNRLRECLNSVLIQKHVQWEMIVVDNFSNDGQFEDFEKEFPWVHFICQDINGGFAQACNKGASQAKGDWLLFLNPDTVLEEGLLQQLLQKLENERNWRIVGVKVYDDDGKDQHQFGNFPRWWTIWPQMRTFERLFRGRSNYKSTLNAAPVSHPDWISGCFFMLRAVDFVELGGWDKRFWMYSEDADLCKRAADKGWDRVLYNEVKCLHAHGGSSRIDAETKAITKCEVIRSEYRYIDKHFTGMGKFIGKTTLVIITAIELLFAAPFSSVKRKMAANLLTGKGKPRVGFEIN